MSDNPSLELCGKTLPLVGWCLVSNFQLLAEDLLRAARSLNDRVSEDMAQQALVLIQRSRLPTEKELTEWKNMFKEETDKWAKDTKEWRYMEGPDFESLKRLLRGLVVGDEATPDGTWGTSLFQIVKGWGNWWPF